MPPHQNGKGGIFGACITAGHGGIYGVEALFLGCRKNSLRQNGRGGGHVNEIGIFFGILNDAVFAQVHFLYVFGIAYDGDDSILPFGAGAWAVTPFGPLGEQALCLGLGAVVDAYFEACRQQVPGHGCAHDACADEADFLMAIVIVLSASANLYTAYLST